MNASDQWSAVLSPLSQPPDTREDSEKRSRSWLNFSIAGLLLLQAVAAIVVFLMQIATALVLFLALLLGFVGLHYLAWGRWLGEAIRQEVEDEERDSEFRASQRFG
jgi:hypothetical protein